jgi:hypothetical protein
VVVVTCEFVSPGSELTVSLGVKCGVSACVRLMSALDRQVADIGDGEPVIR